MPQPLSFLIELFDKLSGPAKAAGDATDKLGDKLDKTRDKMKGHESGWTTLAHKIEVARAGFEVGKRAVEGFVGILEKIGENQATQGIFEDILGKDEGRNVLDWLGKIRASTAFTRDQLEGLAQPLAEFFKGQQLKNVFVAALDVGRGNIERTASVIDTFNKVASTGKISSRAFKTLGLVDTGLFKDLKGGDAGEAAISIERLLELVQKKSGGTLGGRALQSSETVAARINQLKGAPGELWEKLSDSPALPKITASIGKLTDALTSERVVGGVALVVDKLAMLLIDTDWAAVGVSIGNAATALAGLFDLISGPKPAAAPSLAPGDVQVRHNWISRIFGGSKGSTDFVRGADGSIEARRGVLDRIADPNGQAVKFGAEMGKQYAAGMAAGIAAGAPAVSTAAAACGTTAADSTASALQIRSPSRVMERLGRYTAEGFAVGLEGGSARVGEAMASTLSGDVVTERRAQAGGGGRVGSVTFGDIILQGGAAATAREIGEEFESRVRTIARDLFAQDFAIEAGVA